MLGEGLFFKTSLNQEKENGENNMESTTWKYYYMDDHTRTIFHTKTDLEDRYDLIYVGMSKNPNPKMAVAVFTQQDILPRGYKIRPL